jgi:hypothetical protein
MENHGRTSAPERQGKMAFHGDLHPDRCAREGLSLGFSWRMNCEGRSHRVLNPLRRGDT